MQKRPELGVCIPDFRALRRAGFFALNNHLKNRPRISDMNSFEFLNGMLKESMLRLLPAPRRMEGVIKGLALIRCDSGISPERCLCSPMIAYVVQGGKRSFYGEFETNYGEGQCVVLGVDTPSVYQIEGASPERPFLSLSVKLDSQIISHLLSEIPAAAKAQPEPAAPIGIMDADTDILDNFRRLIRLLESPEQIPLFAGALIRELHYFILKSGLGHLPRAYNTAGTKAWGIRRAVAWLRDHYKDNFKIEDAASKANMAHSTFNRHFRQATGLSPLQFQKHLRLHEAERLMLVESYDASSAALAVGYESRSHFTREYKRLFGRSPGKDARWKQSY